MMCSTPKKILSAIALSGTLGLATTTANALEFQLTDTWWFNPGGTFTGPTPDGQRVQRLLLEGYSNVDNDFTDNTFKESGILKVTGWVNVLEQTRNVSELFNPTAAKDIYISWKELTGTFSFPSGTTAAIDFDNGRLVEIWVDDTPEGTLLVTTGTNAFQDDNSFQNLTDGLTQIATLAIVNGATAWRNGVPTPELTGGTFDISLGQGVGNFLIWTEMDVAPNYFFGYDDLNEIILEDLDTIDSSIVAGVVEEKGDLRSRISVDARLAPMSFSDATSSIPPGSRAGAGVGGIGQEDQFETLIQGIYGGALPDFQQNTVSLNGTPVLQNFFVKHTGDFDMQAVPEPGSLALLGIGILGMAASLRSRKRPV